MPTRPNIILVCSDQHRASATGCYGHSVVQTPHLDRLANRGVRFDRCYAQNPVCSPQRCSIHTGLLSRNHGVYTNSTALRHDIPTLAQTLAGAGYQTAALGKMHLTQHSKAPPTAPYYGFEHVENLEDSRIGPYLDWVLREFPEHAGYSIGSLFNLPSDEAYWRGRRDFRKEYLAAREKHVLPMEISKTCNWGFGHYSPLPPEAHQNHWLADRAINVIRNKRDDAPLFLWVGFVDPHNPFDPPAKYRDMYQLDVIDPRIHVPGEEAGWTPHHKRLHEYTGVFTERDWTILRALYYGSVTFMDESIGRIIAEAESRLDMSNTIVLYTSDHGEILGDHSICGKSCYHYDSCIRVPMIARWDGRWRHGGEADEIVELTDLMPTLLDAADVPAKRKMDGRSFSPLLTGQTAKYTPRDHAYAESYAGAPEDPTPAPHNWAKTVRTRRWRATFYPDLSLGELYDLVADPLEVKNLWREAHAHEVIEEHRAILMRRLMLADHPLPHAR